MSLETDMAKRKKHLIRMVKERPYAIETIQMEILFDVASYLSQINKKMEEQVPEGLQVDKTVPVTDELDSFSPSHKWFSVDLYNEGDNTIYYAINDPTQQFVALTKGKSRTINMGFPLIKTIYFRCNQGESSSLQMVGVF